MFGIYNNTVANDHNRNKIPQKMLIPIDMDLNTCNKKDDDIDNGLTDQNDSNISLQDTIIDKNSLDQISQIDKKLLYKKLNQYLNKLSQKQNLVLKFFLKDNKSYEEIGKLLNLSKQVVNYYIEHAIQHLRQYAAQDGFQPDFSIKKSQLKGTY